MSKMNEKNGVTESDLRLDRLASIGQIAAGIAHEVKNPLTAVKGFLQLLRHESPHKYLDHALSELENALATMENLLHVSKPDLADEPFDAIDLCAELESVLFLFQEKFYQITIHKQFMDTDIRIYGKRNPLKKAFFNLLKNAFEAINDTGSVTVKHYRTGNHVVVSVTDTGDGISEDKLHLLGTPFYTSKVEGTGIGLTQVFTAIYELNGNIRVKSELGAGTEFLLQIPIKHADGEAIPSQVQAKVEKKTGSPGFYRGNPPSFMKLFKEEARPLLKKLLEHAIDTETLLNSANEVVRLLDNGNKTDLMAYAEQQGRLWARNQFDLSLQLEWFTALRKTCRDFLSRYCKSVTYGELTLMESEQPIQDQLDTYLIHFVKSYFEHYNQAGNS